LNQPHHKGHAEDRHNRVDQARLNAVDHRRLTVLDCFGLLTRSVCHGRTRGPPESDRLAQAIKRIRFSPGFNFIKFLVDESGELPPVVFG